jgi:hypothetical protein
MDLSNSSMPDLEKELCRVIVDGAINILEERAEAGDDGAYRKLDELHRLLKDLKASVGRHRRKQEDERKGTVIPAQEDDLIGYYNEAIISIEAIYDRAAKGGQPEVLKALSILLLALACFGNSHPLP